MSTQLNTPLSDVQLAPYPEEAVKPLPQSVRSAMNKFNNGFLGNLSITQLLTLMDEAGAWVVMDASGGLPVRSLREAVRNAGTGRGGDA